MTTTIPAAKAALVALFTAGLPTVQVIYGQITAEAITGPNVLTVGATVTGTAEPDALTLGTAAERYSIGCVLSCTVTEIPGDDGQQVASELAWGLYAAAEVLVREYPTQDLGVPGVLGVNVSGEFGSTDTAMPTGRNTAVSFDVNVIAQRT